MWLRRPRFWGEAAPELRALGWGGLGQGCGRFPPAIYGWVLEKLTWCRVAMLMDGAVTARGLFSSVISSVPAP